MEPEKKIIDAYNELQEKYSSLQICDMLDKKIKNDVSEKTVVRVLSYYLVGPTADSPPIPDPLERESNEIASDVERAIRCAPPDLRFDHKIIYEDRYKGQENDRPELLRIDEFSADKTCALGDFRLTMLLTCLGSSDLLIFHKFLACSEIRTKRRKPPKKSIVDKNVAQTVAYTEEELAENFKKLLFDGAFFDDAYQTITSVVVDASRADAIVADGFCRYVQNVTSKDNKERNRTFNLPDGLSTIKKDSNLVYSDAFYTKVAVKLLSSGLNRDDVVKAMTAIIGEEGRAKKLVQANDKLCFGDYGLRILAAYAGLIPETPEEVIYGGMGGTEEKPPKTKNKNEDHS